MSIMSEIVLLLSEARRKRPCRFLLFQVFRRFCSPIGKRGKFTRGIFRSKRESTVLFLFCLPSHPTSKKDKRIYIQHKSTVRQTPFSFLPPTEWFGSIILRRRRFVNRFFRKNQNKNGAVGRRLRLVIRAGRSPCNRLRQRRSSVRPAKRRR